LFAPHQIYLLGETQPRFAEKVITLFQSGHGHAIAEARVNADGTFVLLTAMPSSKVLIYRVRVGKTFSSPTKLIVPKPSR
jgi:uncharacterized phosphosugar-binding protein